MKRSCALALFAAVFLLLSLCTGCKEKGTYLPVLMYHDINDEKEESGTVVHSDTFRRQMEILRDNAYSPVSPAQVIDFVENGTPLPEKPVLITFDDGYESNYALAYPILREFGFPAVIFAVGFSFGATEFYKDTENRLTPHFGGDAAREMVDSGLITLGSHTYDMHAWAPFEKDPDASRENVLPRDGENEEQYRKVMSEDIEKQHALFAENGLPQPEILAFPNGKFVPLTDEILRENGYKMTLTTDCSHRNFLREGEAQTLFDLGRLCMEGATSERDLLAYLNG